jgi:hypothetical protein
MNPQIDISTTTSITCPVCGHGHFSEQLILRRVSKLLVNSRNDVVMPVPIMVCSSCKTLCEEALELSFPDVHRLLFPEPKSKISLS